MGTVRVLSTKKLLPNHKQYLLNAGLAVVEADFIGIEYLPFALQANSNLIFTSQNAVKSFLMNEASTAYKKHPVFCVGSKTKEAAKKAGYVVVASADYAEQLAAIIVNRYAGDSFTFFSGSMRRNTLPDALTNAGVVFNEIKVYKTALTPHTISATLDGILFFSPSGIESYLSNNNISNETCFCIGTTTADALKGVTENVVIAGRPTVENVIVQCIKYYKES